MMKLLAIFKNQYFWLVLIIILSFEVRLYKLDNPVADWHSWRQADTAAVARNFFKEGFNPLLPRGDDMISISDTLQLNLQRLRFVEFPIYGSLVYFSYLIKGGVDEKLARLIAIAFSLGSIVWLFLIVRKHFGKLEALLSGLLFGILPYNIYYSRVILPEPSLVFFSLGMLYFGERWIWEDKIWLGILSVLFTALAFLTKPTAIFLLLPLVYVFLKKEKKLFPIPKRYIIGLFLAFLPLLLWRLWMSQYPNGIPSSAWLLNGNGIRFHPAFWRWILEDRFGREILTVPGTVLFFIGLLKKPSEKEGALLHLLALSSFLYLIVFATGNVQHDYYQILIIPALVIFLSRGFIALWKGIGDFVPRVWTIPLAVLFMSLTIGLGWYEVSSLYHVNNWSIVEAGQVADKILPKNALVLASYGGDSAFLYQTNRNGFSILPTSIDTLRDKYGVSYYVSVNYDDLTNQLMQKYKVLVRDPRFVIIDLTKSNQ